MKGYINNKLGEIQIGPDVIAMYAGTTAVECFGIVGMAAVSVKDGLVKLLRKDSLKHGISVKIMMPITKPAFASMAILCAMGSWNNMLWPMLVFRDTSKFTLQIGLNTLLTPYGNNYNLLIAGSMFGILPILIIYLIFQRYLIDGMTSGGLNEKVNSTF